MRKIKVLCNDGSSSRNDNFLLLWFKFFFVSFWRTFVRVRVSRRTPEPTARAGCFLLARALAFEVTKLGFFYVWGARKIRQSTSSSMLSKKALFLRQASLLPKNFLSLSLSVFFFMFLFPCLYSISFLFSLSNLKGEPSFYFCIPNQLHFCQNFERKQELAASLHQS
jgi:hypothetical protein